MFTVNLQCARLDAKYLTSMISFNPFPFLPQAAEWFGTALLLILSLLKNVDSFFIVNLFALILTF